MGLIDGVYAIAMTLIAIELPELASQLIDATGSQIQTATISGLLIYELITYTVAFFILYELWILHKSILKISGIKQNRKNFINGLIMALTCLSAGNIILILKTKTNLASSEIKSEITQATILKDWISHDAAASICMLLIISSMFGLMSLLARTKQNHKEANKLKTLERSTRRKSFLFLLFPLNWLPLMVGGQSPLIPVSLLILAYISLSHINPDKFKKLMAKHRKRFRRTN